MGGGWPAASETEARRPPRVGCGQRERLGPGRWPGAAGTAGRGLGRRAGDRSRRGVSERPGDDQGGREEARKKVQEGAETVGGGGWGRRSKGELGCPRWTAGSPPHPTPPHRSQLLPALGLGFSRANQEDHTECEETFSTRGPRTRSSPVHRADRQPHRNAGKRPECAHYKNDEARTEKGPSSFFPGGMQMQSPVQC